MLISDDYLALQREMHRDASYGTSGHKYAADVATILNTKSYPTILDYGCGKGLLKKELERMMARAEIRDWFDVREYDPAIEGKDQDPEPAHLVVCTDVLEHIEEEHLDDVLDHIRKRCRSEAYFAVATRPAVKSLPDGRNAHISLHDVDWWLAKIGKFFNVDRFVVNEGHSLILSGRPFLRVGDIETFGVMNADERWEHAKVNCAITPKRVAVHAPHERVAILCCYGPSLQNTYPDVVLQAKDYGDKADIVTVSGAHDFLIGHSITPRFHIEIDPREHKGMMTKLLDPGVTYLYASCCHPEVVKRVAPGTGYNLVLWHLQHPGFQEKIAEIEPEAMLVGGGASVGLRAFALLAMMGYRRFIVHGMDCSHADDGRSHAGEHTGKPQKSIEVISYGRKFLSSPVLMAYMQQFDDMRNVICKPPHNVEIILMGDGMLQWSTRKAMEASNVG